MEKQRGQQPEHPGTKVPLETSAAISFVSSNTFRSPLLLSLKLLIQWWRSDHFKNLCTGITKSEYVH